MHGPYDMIAVPDPAPEVRIVSSVEADFAEACCAFVEHFANIPGCAGRMDGSESRMMRHRWAVILLGCAEV
jgi:hypothetical protein